MVINYTNLKFMFRNFLYPFFSIAVIETGNLIENISAINTLLILALQLTIGILTIIKLYKDIKSKKYKSLEQTEKTVSKKYPFISAILKIFKK